MLVVVKTNSFARQDHTIAVLAIEKTKKKAPHPYFAPRICFMLRSLIIMLPMAVSFFWFVMLTLDLWEHGNRGAHRSLWLWTLVTTLLYLGHTFFFFRYKSFLPFTDSLYTVFHLAVYPLYLRYLCLLTEGRFSLLRNLLVGLPPLLFGTAVGTLYWAMDHDSVVRFIEGYLYNNSWEGLRELAYAQAVIHLMIKSLFAVGVLVCIIYGTVVVRRYNRLVESLYSDVEDKRLHSVEFFLQLMLLIGVLSFVSNTIGRHYFAHSLLPLAFISLSFSCLLFALNYVGYRQLFSYTDIDFLPEEEVRSMGEEEATHASSQFVEELAVRIENAMIQEELFLNPMLKVRDVACFLNTNSRYVQQAFNEVLQHSFAEYVNRLRIDYADRLQREHPEMKINDICFRSGFSSPSSYYRNRKRFQRR